MKRKFRTVVAQDTVPGEVVGSFPSSFLKDDGSPVVVYPTEKARDRGDRIVKCIIVNINMGRDSGMDCVTVNGLRDDFPLGVETELPQFMLDVLRSCRYSAPKVIQDRETGHLKTIGWEQRSIYSIDVVETGPSPQEETRHGGQVQQGQEV